LEKAHKPSSDAAGLRRRAEERLKEKQKNQRSAGSGGVAGKQEAAQEPQRLIQELQIHQIELEMQNEELWESRAEVEAGLELYTDLYDFAPVGYFTFDREGAIRRVNLSGAGLLGTERTHLVNRRFGQFVSEDDRFIFNGFLQKVFTKRDDASGKASCEVALKEQRDRPHLHESPGGRYDDTGATRRQVFIEGTVTAEGQECRAMMTDITERKQAEEEIQKNQAQLSNALEMAHLGHWEYDVANDLFTFNDQFYNIFRTTVEKVGGYAMHSSEYAHRFVHPDDMDMVGEETRKAIETTDPHFNRQIEHRILYADGKVGYISVRFFIVKDSQGRTVKTYGVNQDITERKEAEQKLQDTLESLRKAVNTTIRVMVSAVETRDPYTSGHQTRSAGLARAIATEMGLPQDTIEGIRMAGSIHDIGKLSIPAEILSKPTKLSDIEFRLIKEHARQGYEILKDVESPWPLAEIVHQHHERMDGSGYPGNLKGDEILIEARILAVADVVEAMASHRPYRAGLGIDAALKEIEQNRGVFYDSDVVDACLTLFREKGFKLEKTWL